MFRRLLATSNDYSLTILRIAVGAIMLAHGLQKVFGWFGGHGIPGTVSSFQQYFGFPPFVTALVILAESLGAFALMLGFLSRITAASIGLVMVGAIYFVTGRWGFYMNWYSEERGEGFEFHLLVLATVLVLVLKGGGKWSLDRHLTRNASP